MILRLLAAFGLLLVVSAEDYDRYYSSNPSAFRNTIGEIRVYNGGPWGVWKPAVFCPGNTYAIGYSQKIEDYQGNGDDTALNNIALLCGDRQGTSHRSVIVSPSPGWGRWRSTYTCRGDDSFLVNFALQVEPRQGRGDDTAANFVKFSCRNFDGGYTQGLTNDIGRWGSFGYWSPTCPPNSAICGMRTKYEDWESDNDDTALNDVIFYCCS